MLKNSLILSNKWSRAGLGKMLKFKHPGLKYEAYIDLQITLNYFGNVFRMQFSFNFIKVNQKLFLKQ